MLFEKQIQNYYRSRLYRRCDPDGTVFYFSAEDFPGLNCRASSFRANAGHALHGWFYYYDNPIAGRIVVFDHGMGNGHRAYLREIEHLAKAGYLVYTYDHTGCAQSEGAHIGGFAQSLNDLDACLKHIKALPQLQDRKISVMGHSWGGFSTMNIAALHPDITHVVSIAGFICVEKIVEQSFPGLMKGYVKGICQMEQHANPEYYGYHAVETLEKTNARVLLIYSDNDPLVHKNPHYDALYAALKDKPNVQLLLESGKGHSPHYSARAVAQKDAFFADLKKMRSKLTTDAQKKAFLDRYDWNIITEQDAAVWEVILKTLEEV